MSPDVSAEVVAKAIADAVHGVALPYLRALTSEQKEKLDLTLAQLRTDVDAAILEAVKSIPPGRDGTPGKDGAPGRDGRDGKAGQDGRDGVSGKDGRDGILSPCAHWINRSYERGELVTYKNGLFQALMATTDEPGVEGAKGWVPVVDGVSQIEVRALEDGTSYEVAVVHSSGIKSSAGTITLPKPLSLTWRKLWHPDKVYGFQDIAAWNGSAWIANKAAPSGEPGESADWDLMVKRGDRGKEGQRGERGDKGERGDSGAAGEAGAKGEKGDTGAEGREGQRGLPGTQGDRGEPGEKGERGEAGLSGKDGRNGIDGLPGAQGTAGRDGKDGLPGAQGKQGDKGERGDRGERGETGLQGGQGKPGKDGLPGAQGKQGDVGPRGTQGDRGLKGDKGDPGRDGLPGASGPIGPEGKRGERGFRGEPGVRGDNGRDGRGVNYRRAWAAGEWYDTCDIVKHGGSVWIALDKTNETPSSDSKSWDLLIPGAL